MGDVFRWITFTDDKVSIGYTTNKLRALSIEGIRNYSGALVDLVVFTLGVVNGSWDTWKKTNYDQDIAEAVVLFTDCIPQGTKEELKDAMQNLIFAIFSQKRIGTADKYNTLVYSFLVLYSFCKDGNLNRCNMFTQYFSRVIWFGRVSIFNVITEDAEVDKLGFFE